MEPSVTTMLDDRTRSSKNAAQLCYLLHAVGIIFTLGTATVISVVINYIKRPDSQGTFVFSHHNYMIRTFWWTVFWAVLIWTPILLTFGLAGVVLWIPLLILGIWFIYRLIKGWLRLNENRAVE
jgi:uncharacterized membrane protein